MKKNISGNIFFTEAFISPQQNSLDEKEDRNDKDDEDSDVPQLSEHALAALQEFYAEQKHKKEQLTSEGNTEIDEDWVCHVSSIFLTLGLKQCLRFKPRFLQESSNLFIFGQNHVVLLLSTHDLLMVVQH